MKRNVNWRKCGCLKGSALFDSTLSALRNSLASRTRARHHVDIGHVTLADISENGIILT